MIPPENWDPHGSRKPNPPRLWRLEISEKLQNCVSQPDVLIWIWTKFVVMHIHRTAYRPRTKQTDNRGHHGERHTCTTTAIERDPSHSGGCRTHNSQSGRCTRPSTCPPGGSPRCQEWPCII